MKKGDYSLSEVSTNVQKNGNIKRRHEILPNPLVFYRWELLWNVSQNKKTECHSELMTVK